jgi:hypothetical protein
MATRADLVLYQGDDYAATVTVSNGLPPDEVLVGYTAQAQIRESVADESPAVLIEIGTAVVSPLIVLSIPRDQTVELCGGNYVWDLQLTAADGTVTTILAGAVRVTPEVTRV